MAEQRSNHPPGLSIFFPAYNDAGTIASLVILALCGAATTVNAPRISANLPTPWVGIWERINIGVFLLWIVVLATMLLRARDTAPVTGRHGARAA